MDQMIYRLNEHEQVKKNQEEEIKSLTQVIEQYERLMVKERTENEKKTREVELLQKAKEQKERHMAVLVKEKEKVLKQMDQIVNASNKRPTTAKPVSFVYTAQQKENTSIISNSFETHSVIGNLTDLPSDIKKE